MSQAGLDDLIAEGDSNSHVDLYVTNVEYTEQGGKPILHLFGRDESGDFWHVEEEGHRPSFFVPESEFGPQITNHYAVYATERHAAEGTASAAQPDSTDSGDVAEGERYTDMHNNPLVRIFTYLPKQVKDLRQHFDNHYEADVFYDTRWLIDNEIYTGARIELPEGWGSGSEDGTRHVRVDKGAIEPTEPPEQRPRTIITDIEVASEEGMPDKSEARWPVSTIVAWDSYENEYVHWLLEHKDHSQETLIGIAEGDGDYRVFSDESEMLDDFNTYLANRNPDLLSGWYSSSGEGQNDGGFDYPYLINRCRNLDVWSFKDWSPVGDVYTSNWGPVVKGVTMFDMLDGYDKTKRGEYSGKLDDVAQEELDEEKIVVEESHTHMWKDDPVRFLEYNKKDVELVKRIEEDRGIIELYDRIREITGAQFDDCHANIDLLDVLFLRKAKEQGMRLPTATKNDESWYYGAEVLDPKAGIHENAIYYDLSSLYPMTMLMLNIGTDTLIGFDDSDYDGQTVNSYVDDRPRAVKKESEPEGEVFYYEHPDENESFIRTFIDDMIGLKEHYRGTDMYTPVKMVTNCFTPDTEVLTPSGVVNIRDLDVGDDVYSIDPDSMQVEVKPVEKVWEYPDYDGKLVNIENTVTDLSVTPNHRLLTHKWRKDDSFEWRHVGELNEWSEYRFPHEWDLQHGDDIERVSLSHLADEYEVKIDTDVHGRTLQAAVDWSLEYSSGYYIVDADTYEEYESEIRQLVGDDELWIHGARGEAWAPMVWDGDDFIQFCAWYITEGSQYTNEERHYENGHHRGESTKIEITQYDTGEGNVGTIRDLLDSIGLTYSESDRGFEITGSKVVADVLKELCGVGAENKQIPDMFFDSSERQKKLLYDTLMDGDGDANRNRYTTISETLRDDFMQLALHIGLQPKYHWESGVGRHGDGVWRVRPIDSKNTFTVAQSGETVSAESGVYSVTVEDNHTVLAGRNGKFQFVGQSVYGVLSDGDSYGGKGFRLFDWKLGESITLAGRRVLKFTQERLLEKFEERGYDPVAAGGDTDSVVVSVPDADDREELLDVAMEIGGEVNDEYEAFVRDEFGVDENFMEVEVESLASKLFIPHGATTKTPKKRYAQHIVWDDDSGWDADETKITGLEYVRSDTAGVTSEAQKKFVDILLDKPLGEAKEEYYEWLNNYVERIRSGDIGLDKLGRPKGIGQPLDEYGTATDKPQPTYKGAKYANSFIYDGAKIAEGDKPYMYYVDEIGGDYPVRFPWEWDTGEAGTKVDAVTLDEPSDMPDEISVDIEKMITKTLRVPLGRMFAPLGWDFDEALSDTDQSNITEYF